MAANMVSGILILVLITVVSSYSEPGIMEMTFSKENTAVAFPNTLYKNTKIIVKLLCHDDKVRISSWLWESKCVGAFIDLSNSTVDSYMRAQKMGQSSLVNASSSVVDCSTTTYLEADYMTQTIPAEPDVNKGLESEVPSVASSTTTPRPSESSSKQKRTAKGRHSHRTKRADDGGKNKNKGGKTIALHDTEPIPLYTVTSDGVYMLIIRVEDKHEISLTVQMKSPYGYLSAMEWPLLPFYGTMCVIYVIYGIAWLVMLAMNWRDLLRIQFWIGAVILLGMLEKAVYFGEYESINTTGVSVKGALIFAELVSSLKRTLARMLVIIVSLGFGIVKPRLGADQNKVVGVGVLYFILSSVEGCMRVSMIRASKNALIAYIPLSVLEAAICWWIFTSLVQTTRTLRLRRNIVKLSLYRHFTNTLIFAVLASMAYIIWSLKQHRFAVCLSDWKEIWVDDAFWHMLFCVILLVIIILWRPTINNQRYAFSPLLDPVDEDEDEAPLNDAFDGMKMRPKSDDGHKHEKEKRNKVDDDLKWIDENIPASVADAALPSLLDSDEEIMTTKFEVSKME